MKNTLTFRVIYRDTDAEGVVYYANYLGWFEAGRGELIRDLGISLKKLKDEDNLVFAVRDIFCEYLKPARYDEEILVETDISELKTARIIFSQKILRKSDKAELVRAKITLFPINIKTFKPLAIPDSLRSKLKA
jgi:acyl-CoA thioester hydrolase